MTEKRPAVVLSDHRLVRDLVRVGTQELKHRYIGACPDYTQTEMRDPLCAACKVLIRAASDEEQTS